MDSIWKDITIQPDEYGDFYRDYIEQVGAGNILDILKNQMRETYTLINSLTREQALHRYADGKWTVKEVIGHLIDTERIFAYRALCFSRSEQIELPGFDQEAYVDQADFNSRSKQNLGNEYFAVRSSTVHMFSGFSKEMLMRKGVANDTTFTARALPFIIAGHERHHLNILKSKYGLNFYSLG